MTSSETTAAGERKSATGAASATSATAAGRGLQRATVMLFFVAVASLPFMQPFAIPLLGSVVQLADALFGLVGVAWVGSLIAGGTTLRRGRFYGLIGGFFAAICLTMALSPARSVSRLVIEIYLIGLSVLAYNIVRSLEDLRRVWLVWTGTATFTAATILLSVVLFYALGWKDPKANLILWSPGSLPVGNYPRVRGFFLNGNMTGNYLAVSACLAVGLAGVSTKVRAQRWALGAGLGMCAAALFTLSTALGGLALAIGLFAWVWQRGRRGTPLLKGLLPLAGVGALGLLLFTAAYPKKLATGMVLEASPRWLTWASSWKSFLAHPLFGNGLGVPLADVYYDAPRGVREHLTDPHNAWLSVAGQTGVVGLIAFLALLLWFARGLRGMALGGDRVAAARAALVGVLLVLVYQGFSCSLEDMRHVWVVFGLMAGVVESRAASGAGAGAPPGAG